MTEPEQPTHSEDPAEGADPSAPEGTGHRTPHSEDPAEGVEPSAEGD